MHIVDLSHPLSQRAPNWEGSVQSPFRAEQLGSFQRDGYFSRIITTPEHFGTHLDAPAHFCESGWRVDEIPAQRLMGPLVVINVAAACSRNPDYQVSPADIASNEREHGGIPRGAIVLAHTGWAARWNSMELYRNADTSGVTHYPGYAVDTVRLLVEERGIVGLGIDTMGVDFGPSRHHPNHRYTGAHNIYHLENVANLGSLPPRGATLIVAPMKLEGGSGAPARVFALLD